MPCEYILISYVLLVADAIRLYRVEHTPSQVVQDAQHADNMEPAML